MYISAINIHGFGKFCEAQVQNIPAGLVVFQGDNEAGKSTLLAFIRAILFGFPRRNDPEFYEAMAGGVHGGKLSLTLQDNSIITVSRRHAPRQQPVVVTMPDGQAGGQMELDRMLGGITGPVFKSVYAFSLDELQDFDSLSDDTVSTSLYGLSTGTTAMALPRALSRINSRLAELFKPGGSNPLINQKLRHLEEIQTDLHNAIQEASQYDNKIESLRTVQADIQDHEQSLAKIRKDLVRYETYQRLRPDWRDLRVTETELDTLPARIETFPRDGLARMKAEADSINEAKRRLKDHETEIQEIQKTVDAIQLDAKFLEQESVVTLLLNDLGQFSSDVNNLAAEHQHIARCQQRIDAEIEKLGRDWAEEKVLAVDLSLFTRQGIRNFENRIGTIDANTHIIKEQLAALQHDYDLQLEVVSKSEESLVNLGTPDPVPDAEALRELQTGRNQFESVINDLPKVREELERAERVLSEFIKGIDPGWTKEDVSRFDTSTVALLKVEEAGRQNEDLLQNAHDIQKQMEAEQHAFAELQEKKDDIENELESLGDPRISSMDEAQTHKERIRELRRTLSAYSQESLILKDRERHLAHLEGRCRSEAPGPFSWVSLFFILALLFAAGSLGLAGWLAYSVGWISFLPPSMQPPSWWSLGMLAAGAAFLLFMVLLSVYLVGRKQRVRAVNFHKSLEAETELARTEVATLKSTCEETMAQLVSLSGQAGVEYVIDQEQEIDALEDRLQQDLLLLHSRESLSVSLKRLIQDEQRREAAVHRLKCELDLAEKAILEARQAWRQASTEMGFISEIEPGLAKVQFAKIDSARRDIEQIRSLERRKGSMEQAGSSYLALGQRIPALVCQTDKGPSGFLVAVDDFLRREGRQVELRILIEQQKKTLEQERARLTALERELENKTRELSDAENQRKALLETEWGPWLSSHALPQNLFPQTALDALSTVEKCRIAINEKQLHASKVLSLTENIEDYIKRVRDLAENTDSPVPDSADVSHFVQSAAKRLSEEMSKRSDLAALNRDIGRAQLAAKKELVTIETVRQRMKELFAEAGVENEEDFVRKGEVYARQVSLLERKGQCEQNLRRISGQMELSLLREELSCLSDEDIEVTLHGLNLDGEQVTSSLEEARRKATVLEFDLANLKSADHVAVKRAQEESALAELRDMTMEWSRWKLASFLLEEARKTFENDQQPKVIKSASSFFSQMTNGAYSRIVLPVGERTLAVIGADAERKEPRHLSRGAREQLFLAIRLGYIQQHGEGRDRLPIVMDDVLVNFDPSRAREAARAIVSFAAAQHQLLYFTCHPEMVFLLKEEEARAVVIPVTECSFGRVSTAEQRPF